MGIGDDIRPKTFKRITKHSSKSTAKISKEKDKITNDLFSRPNDDDFFANTPIEKNGKIHKDTPIVDQTLVNHPHNHSYRWLYTLIIILVILILAGLVAWQNLDLIKSFINGSYKKQNDQNLSEIISSTNDSLKKYDTAEQNQTAQPDASQQNATAAAPAIDKSVIKISVLNGSGVKNSAKVVADQLTTAGFIILYTGNASNFNYQQTFIYFKTGNDAQANLVKDSLTGRTVQTKENNSVVGTKYDVVVVVGKT